MVRQFLLLIFIINTLNADLVDLYRTQGIEAVEAKLEENLKNKNYWKNYLKDYDTKYGYYESKEYLIITQKQSKTLKVFKKENNKFLKILDDRVIVGEKEGDKRVEGDKKTPVGAYDLTRKITKLDEFYGPLALVTSYPNNFDKSQKKKGHGIWIHGMPLNEEREEFTKGCIALDNPHLTQLDKDINFNKSVLMISQNDIKDVSKDELSTIFSFIYNWKSAWKNSNLDDYISFYSQEFKKSNGASFDDLKTYKQKLFKRNENKIIQFSNINIMPYPNSLNKTMFKIVMDQVYKTKRYKFEGKKELYIELNNDKVSILSEG